ncbi:MAG: hypothetical protein HRU72_06735 [Planctomycetia bacterium]|nr:hypothetical protein [Candidatus Brocadia sp.]QOJ06269.1 MAG: hypothetical protein HRU72_06735 [Planctomycetia bacterium]TVL94860.1 MAG: hypothetical protein CV082_13170 [Candidatus Brocadia sp. BL1]HQU31573.1 hypothetical protein [Candidatus Brocadia sapporoensis]
MSKIILEIGDDDLLRLGELRIKEEIEQTLKWMKMKGLLKSIASALSSLKIDIEKEVEMIKEDSWQEYKKELPL